MRRLYAVFTVYFHASWYEQGMMIAMRDCLTLIVEQNIKIRLASRSQLSSDQSKYSLCSNEFVVCHLPCAKRLQYMPMKWHYYRINVIVI